MQRALSKDAFCRLATTGSPRTEARRCNERYQRTHFANWQLLVALGQRQGGATSAIKGRILQIGNVIQRVYPELPSATDQAWGGGKVTDFPIGRHQSVSKARRVILGVLSSQ